MPRGNRNTDRKPVTVTVSQDHVGIFASTSRVVIRLAINWFIGSILRVGMGCLCCALIQIMEVFTDLHFTVDGKDRQEFVRCQLANALERLVGR